MAGHNPRRRAAEKLAALDLERRGGPAVLRSPPKGGDPELRRVLGTAMTKRQRMDRLELRLIGLERELVRANTAAEQNADQLVELGDALQRLITATSTGKTFPVDVNDRPTAEVLLARYVAAVMTETGGVIRLAAGVLGIGIETLRAYLGRDKPIVLRPPEKPPGGSIGP